MAPARFLVPAEAGLIALDWGTSALRAFRMGAHGEVLETRHRPWGIMNLPPAPAGHTDTGPDAAFERALQDACGDWLAALPSVPILACGMVGSAQGWREAKYLHAPTSLDALARGLTQKLLHGAMAELHSTEGAQREHLAQTVSRLFLRQTTRGPSGFDRQS